MYKNVKHHETSVFLRRTTEPHAPISSDPLGVGHWKLRGRTGIGLCHAPWRRRQAPDPSSCRSTWSNLRVTGKIRKHAWINNNVASLLTLQGPVVHWCYRLGASLLYNQDIIFQGHRRDPEPADLVHFWLESQRIPKGWWTKAKQGKMGASSARQDENRNMGEVEWKRWTYISIYV